MESDQINIFDFTCDKDFKITKPIRLIELFAGYGSQTLTTSGGEDVGVVEQQANNLCIRRLTPKECFRLMGVKDEDFERIAEHQCQASLYHLAGDSIITNVLMAIFKQLL